MNNKVSKQQNTLQFPNQYGGFDVQNHEYVIHHGGKVITPRPWANVIANKHFGTIVTESSFGATWFDNSKDKRITGWSNDTIIDTPSEVIYIKDRKTGEYWSATRNPIKDDAQEYVTRHGMGYSIFETSVMDFKLTTTVVVDKDDPVKIISVQIENTSTDTKELSLYHYLNLVMGGYNNQFDPFIKQSYEPTTDSLRIKRTDKAEFNKYTFVGVSEKIVATTFSKVSFFGYMGAVSSPQGIASDNLISDTTPLDPCSVLQSDITIEAGKKKNVTFILGVAHHEEEEQSLLEKYRNESVEDVVARTKEFWIRITDTITITTPDPMMDLIFNQWALYQTLSCRIWGRSSFYQSSGAYGFRDQLQDSMALVYSHPEICREHILRAAARQFEEGDVSHWWFEDSGLGVRNKVADSPLWLAYVTDFYVEKTGDTGIYDEIVPYIKGKPLTDDIQAYVDIPQQSELRESLWFHCIKCIEKVCDFGSHGIPLIKEGDWNDGMNLVGELGKGESIWLGWFLGTNLTTYIRRAQERGDEDTVVKFQNILTNLTESMHNSAWDGAWYLRAYTDEGHKLGTAGLPECMIDSISQTWSVLSDLDDRDRQKTAMQSLLTYLVDHDNELAMLLYPAFDNGPLNPGYIKDYVPGIRENGGQYSHAAFWVVMALAKEKDGDMAHRILQYTNPIYRSRDTQRLLQYELEPFVLGGDIYSSKQHMAKGGWSWYSASSGLYYRTVLESIVGFKLNGNKLTIDPCVPHSWRNYSVRYRYGSSYYDIKVSLGEKHTNKVQKISIDWQELETDTIELIDDGKEHKVLVFVL